MEEPGFAFDLASFDSSDDDEVGVVRAKVRSFNIQLGSKLAGACACERSSGAVFVSVMPTTRDLDLNCDLNCDCDLNSIPILLLERKRERVVVTVVRKATATPSK